jgi:hypothetical protein
VPIGVNALGTRVNGISCLQLKFPFPSQTGGLSLSSSSLRHFFLLLDGERRGKRVDEAHVALAGDEARKDPAKSPTDRPDCLFFIPFPRRVAALAHVV